MTLFDLPERPVYGPPAPPLCELHRLGMSASAASDIRVGWPACVRWEAEE